MKPILRWKPQADEDLIEIYATIGLNNQATAERTYRQIIKFVALLSEFPRIGIRRPVIAPSVRMLVHGVYVILYRTVPDADEGPIDTVEVLRIVDGRRNLSKLFSRT